MLVIGKNCINIQIILRMRNIRLMIVLICLVGSVLCDQVQGQRSTSKNRTEGNLLKASSKVGNCQTIPGCLTCADGICQECTDHDRAVVNEDGECECWWEDETFDTEGQCVQCRINGCKTCKHDGSFTPSECDQCVDTTATIVGGKCVCQEHQLMLDGVCSQCPWQLVDGKCEACPILGCAVCGDGATCSECTHPSHWTAIISGQCQCLRDGESFNVDGVCSLCDVRGCSFCANDHYESHSCLQCTDPGAILEDDTCLCEGGVEMNQEDFCLYCKEQCNSEGCSCCREDDSIPCLLCTDDRTVVNEDGECECQWEDETFDTEGQCVQCRINGCKTCKHDGSFTPSECDQCVDTTATIVGGKCVCQEHQLMLDGVCSQCPWQLVDGKCEACPILGCAVCGDGATCSKCTHPSHWTDIVAGQCQCLRYGESFNVDGVCSLCEVPGCSLCANDHYESHSCVQCTDPRAILEDDTCLCEGGVEMNQEDFCLYCKEQCNSEGCSCCREDDSIPCLLCTDDDSAVVNEDGECECWWEDETFDTEGQCVQCRINGCKTCKHDGSFTPSECDQCVDTTATIIGGKCVCQEHQLMLDGVCSQCPWQLVDGKCEVCPILGCAVCGDGATCSKCTHPSHWTDIVAGQCQCLRYGESFNVDGVCSLCEVPGCSLCPNDHYESHSCLQCTDPRAVLEDDVCQCEGVDFNSAGYCLHCNEQCKAEACACCQQDDSSKCLQCVDTYWAFINEKGQCQCWLYWQKPNSNGICWDCDVEGCGSCEAEDWDMCHRCIDPQAEIVDGECVCPEGTELNGEGLCWACNVPGCDSCSSDSQNVCQQCSEGFLKADDGKCECEDEEEKINQKGLCSACEVQGCVSCSSTSSEQCRFCVEDTFLYEQQCICIEGSQAVNEEGYCSECSVYGCASCLLDSPGTCRICQKPLILEAGTCRCPVEGQKLSSEGVCQNCAVEGCSSCKSSQPNICVKCSDCRAFLTDGQCVCPPSTSWLPTANACSHEEQAVDSPVESPIQSNLREKKDCSEGCEACDSGSCSKCEEGFFLHSKQKQCRKCDPRCSTCEGKKCLSFYPGWGEHKGEITHCVVSNCENCSQNIGKCEQCKENYILRNSSFCQLDQSKKSKLSSKIQMSFQEFIEKFNKKYENDKEKEKREEIFNRKLEEMEDLQTHVSYKLGVNQFFDQTYEQLGKIMKSYKPSFASSSKLKSSKAPTISSEQLSSVPESLDWREERAVTSVKDQGDCGSCWAFAAAAGAESTLILSGKENITVDLSEQYLVECTFESDCDGTYDMNHVMKEILEGIPRENTYPYLPFQSNPGICETDQRVDVAENFFEYRELNDEEIISLLQKGPLVITISADGWQFYSSGVIQCSYFASINHAVLLVGYTSDYWLIKNSWHESWGEEGYARISRERSENCFIGDWVLEFEFERCKIPGCLKCDSSNYKQCLECHSSAELVGGVCECPEEGFVFSGDECVPCRVVGCAQCEISNPDRCEVCSQETKVGESGQCECEDPSHKPTNEGTCVRCEVEGCQVCGAQNTCMRCVDCSTSLKDGQCSCEENFKMNATGHCLLDTESLPLICPSPFIPVDEVCTCPLNHVEVGRNCLECYIFGCELCELNLRNQPICEECIEGKILIDNLCKNCPSQTYFSNGSCLPCIEDCLICLSDVTCDKCADGLIFMNQQCSSCGVIGCRVCSSVGVCEECMDSRAFVVDAGQKCQCSEPLIQTEMGYCFEAPEETSETTSPGMVPGEQLQCPIGCQQCSSVTQCSRCLSNFFKEEGQCIQCDCSCLTCKGSTEQDCLSCPTGFFLSEHSCLSCLTTNCLSCSAPQLCTACAETFVLDDGHCASCPHNCVQCHSPSICTECEAGFSVQSDGSCMECLSSCSSCSSADVRICQSCSSGHYLASGQCLSCTGNCLECDSPSRCTVCKQGFVERDGECAQQCSRPCLECSFSDGQQHCSKCLGGYTVEGHECQPDLSCNQDSSCEACPFGTALAEGTCQTCRTPDSSCRKCSAEDLSRCLSCSPGFFLEKGSCQACGAGCDECQSANFCVACSEGFFELLADGSRTGKCSPCQSPCLACGKSASECLSCVDGFSKEGWKCISDIRVIFGLLFDADIRAFIREIPEFRAFLTSLLSLSIPDDSITLTLLESGSVRVQGSLQARSSAEGQTIFEDLSSKLKEGKSVLGYEIMESEIEKNNIEHEENPSDPKESINQGMIIGITVGGTILLVILIIILIILCRRKEKSNQKEDIPNEKEKNQVSNVAFSGYPSL